MSWCAAGSLTEIPARGARVVKTGDGNVAVFRTSADEVFALADRCPHKQGPLSQGIVHGTSVTCPLHDWVIDLNTGSAVGPDSGCTSSYPVKVEDGLVYVDVPDG
jgi:nitrite reductase (NADH) small subunit